MNVAVLPEAIIYQSVVAHPVDAVVYSWPFIAFCKMALTHGENETKGIFAAPFQCGTSLSAKYTLNKKFWCLKTNKSY